MRVLSLNTYVGHPCGMPLTKSDIRFLDIISLIQGENPDIICLQEVFSEDVREGIRKALSDTHKDISGETFVPWSLVFIRTFLVAGISSIIFYQETWALLVWALWGFFTSTSFAFMTGHNTGLMTLVSNEFYGNVQWADHFLFEKSCENDPQNILISHGFICVQMLHPEYGHINVINTHLDAYGNARIRQVNEIILKCSQIINVVVGDMNATENDEEIVYLAEMLGNWNYHEPGKTWKNYGIDHIISKEGIVKNYKVLTEKVSDHATVVADI